LPHNGNRAILVALASQAAERVFFVIPSEARDLLFFSTSKEQQIPRANPALRNDKLRVLPQPLQPVCLCLPLKRKTTGFSLRGLVLPSTKTHRLKPAPPKPTPEMS
jgi:hypothetical protein